MATRPRETTDDEFLDGFGRQIARLDIQITNVDAGQDVVRDDIAGSLRTLFCRGKGDDAIRRFCRRFAEDQPALTVTPRIENVEDLQFGFCSLPYEADDGETILVHIPDDLAETTCALVRNEEHLQSFSWEDVVGAYGNTFGSHLSTTIPELFDRVQIYGIGHVDFGTFMLRNLAVAVSSCCHDLIRTRIAHHTNQPHDSYFNGIRIPIAMYYRRGTQDDLQACVQKENWLEAGTIMTVVRPEGNLLALGVAEGGRLTISVRDA